MTGPELTDEQREVIEAFAHKYGREWKEVLRNAWFNGKDIAEHNGHLLRQVRNNLGPRWLLKFNLETDKWTLL